MPVTECQLNGRDGFKWGSSGTCYTHDGTAAGRAAAKQKAVKQAIAANKGTAPRELEQAEPELVAQALREYAGLETVDLEGVEILEADVTIHGVGSPPEGDRWSSDDLRGMATAAQELEQAGEWRVPAKIGAEPLGRSKLGHGKEQTLLNSGELPAAGWLANQRVSDDGKKLVADVKDVPRKIADLIKAKAYRTRSSELGSVKSQKTGKQYPWVVTGLGWLGGKMPAVRTLDEVLALYEGDDAERRFVQSDEIDAPELDELRDAMAGFGTDYAHEFSRAMSTFRARADIRPVPSETTKKYTDEQRKAFAEATGLEEEKVTDDLLAKVGVTVEGEEPATEPKVDPAKQLEADERFRSLEQRVEDEAKARRELEAKLQTTERDTWLEHEVLRAGKATPGQRDEIVAMYEEAPERTRKFFETAPVNDEWAREYGVDSEEITDEQREAENKAYEADAQARLGVAEVL